MSLADGVAAVAILVGLQTAVAFASTRSARAAHLLTGEPVLVAHHGRLLEDALRRQRLTGEQVLQAVRAAGCASLEDVGAVVLEPNGNLSILGAPSGRALDGVGR